jgi:RNA polymerase sigma factor (sigma-70 family)
LPFPEKYFPAVQHSTNIFYFIINPIHLDLTVTIPSADALVEQSIRGDISAYRLLYERYSKAMFNTALRITANRADAEDVLQDSFTDAFLQLKSFESKATFGAWLKQIVVYKSIALLKRRKISFADLQPETATMADEEPIDEAEIEYNVAAIKKAINELPDGYRAVLSLYLLEGYDHEEIADIMQISQSTVRTQYKRGKQRLLQTLKKENVHE